MFELATADLTVDLDFILVVVDVDIVAEILLIAAVVVFDLLLCALLAEV